MASSIFLTPSVGQTTFDSAVTINVLALGTTSTRGLLVQNTTAATAGVTVQISPRIEWLGTAWDTSASETVAFFSEVLPATAATPTGQWKLGYSLNGGAATYPLIMGSNGNLAVTASVLTGSGSSGIWFNLGSNGRILGPADAQFNFVNAANAAGVGMDTATDAILKVRTRAQTGYATVDALAYQVSGVAGIDTTITSGSLVGKTITVSKGIITGFV